MLASTWLSICIGKTCSTRWINNLKESPRQSRGDYFVIPDPLKYPSNACLSYLDNGKECNLFKVPKYHGCLTRRCLSSKQVSYQNKTLKYLTNIKAFLTCHCVNQKYIYTYNLTILSNRAVRCKVH